MAGKLEHKQEALIAAILTEPTLTAAAKKAGVPETTMYRWLQLPAFQEAYRAARRQLVEAAIAQLQGLTSDAVEALKRNLTAGRPGEQIRAALGILEHALKAVELMDLATRVEELERCLRGEVDAIPCGEVDPAGGGGEEPQAGAGTAPVVPLPGPADAGPSHPG